MKNNWNKQLVEHFRKSEELRNLISIREDSEGCLDPKELYQEYFFHTSILYCYNPYFVGYNQNDPENKELLTYSEAIEKELCHLCLGELYFYYPLCFKSMYEYMDYVTSVGEKMF